MCWGRFLCCVDRACGDAPKIALAQSQWWIRPPQTFELSQGVNDRAPLIDIESGRIQVQVIQANQTQRARHGVIRRMLQEVNKLSYMAGSTCGSTLQHRLKSAVISHVCRGNVFEIRGCSSSLMGLSGCSPRMSTTVLGGKMNVT